MHSYVQQNIMIVNKKLINRHCVWMFRGRSWSADRVQVEVGTGSREWGGKGASRRRAGKHAAGGRKQISTRREQDHAESRNIRSPR